MEAPNKPSIAIYILIAVLLIGVGLYLVFTGQMDSRTYLRIGLVIGGLGVVIRSMRGS